MNTSNWSVSKIYLYLLALITFLVLLYNFVNFTRTISDLVFPHPAWVMDSYSARQDLFIRDYGIGPDLSNPEHTEKLTAFTKEEVEEHITETRDRNAQDNRNANARTAIRHGFSFLLLLPVHIYFFKLARKPEL